MTETVLVIGSGGREHALCWKLAQSPKVQKIYVAPGNAGTALETKVSNVADLDIKNHQAVVEWCKASGISLVVVGPEDPLASGIADTLSAAGVPCFGPTKAAAQIEANKSFAKDFMCRHNIPTARWSAFTCPVKAKEYIRSAPFCAQVVKASGLAAGKGVVVASSREEACEAVDRILVHKAFGAAGETIIVEELLLGEEVSVLAFSDGKSVAVMCPAHDHKRLLDGDEGVNTGGMGAYCPSPLLNTEDMKLVEQEVIQGAVDGLRDEGIPYVGVLYAGLMVTREGPKVLEYNCRFGDPEAEVMLPLLDSDLYQVMKNCVEGSLGSIPLNWKKDISAVGVFMASGGYPGSYAKGKLISGIDNVSKLPDHIVFHAGTAVKDDAIVTNGGRVLLVIAMAAELATAAARALNAASTIRFEGSHFRRDIAHRGIARSILKKGQLTYKSSGVDIGAGDSLVQSIKPLLAETRRPGVLGSVGSFGGFFDLKAAGYKDPILVAGTDGVGTKVKIAQMCNRHATVGVDLVAMCVNDVLTHGAEPLFFLDYAACGKLDAGVAKDLVAGMAQGCQIAGCALIGGETAEMPGVYADRVYDLAGFAVGAVERDCQLPQMDKIIPGDVVIGIASSGIHSNGFSLVRRVMEKSGLSHHSPSPFRTSYLNFGEELLTPTKIYVQVLLPTLQSGKVKAAAHITGGGLTENIPRVLPENLGVRLDARRWHIQPVFGWIAGAGEVSEAEMLRTFNCGIGAVLIVGESEKSTVQKMIEAQGETANVVGCVVEVSHGEPHVKVQHFAEVLEPLMMPHIKVPGDFSLTKPHRKRVGVLVSGTGTNLQALINHTMDPLNNSSAQIVLVISNKGGVLGVERAQKAGIPTKVILHTEYSSRVEFDRAMDAALTAAGVEIVCLAGFMRILSGEFVQKWSGYMINIHPSLLPAFKGTNGYRQALEAGVRVTGCTVHFVKEEIDSGAIIVQEVIPVELGDTEETLQERGKAVEHRAFPKGLELVASGKVHLEDKKLVWNI